MRRLLEQLKVQLGKNPKPLIKLGIKVFLFLAAGLPGIALAFPLNYFFVTVLHWPTPVAYAIVLLFQVSLNFFFCRWFVFERSATTTLLNQFSSFMAGILLFRLFDWGLYVFLVEVCGWYFLWAQLMNVFLFAILKFQFTRKVMEG